MCILPIGRAYLVGTMERPVERKGLPPSAAMASMARFSLSSRFAPSHSLSAEIAISRERNRAVAIS